MSNNFDMIGLFTVPLIKIKFKDHYKYNFPEVEKKDRTPKGWKMSLNSTFPNIPDDDLVVLPMVRNNLKKDLKFSIVETFEQLNIPTNIDFTQLWYNIYHDNQGQVKHTHFSEVGFPVPFWSGIYYNKKASPTKFFNINAMINTQKFKGWEESEMAPCLAEGCLFPVEDGDIILFPPYLPHSVESTPAYQNKMRMTFSFNITLI
jgi:hypothetical protein